MQIIIEKGSLRAVRKGRQKDFEIGDVDRIPGAPYLIIVLFGAWLLFF
jgi:hypothetical protein